jgi:hypothetical protein
MVWFGIDLDAILRTRDSGVRSKGNLVWPVVGVLGTNSINTALILVLSMVGSKATTWTSVARSL